MSEQNSAFIQAAKECNKKLREVIGEDGSKAFILLAIEENEEGASLHKSALGSMTLHLVALRNLAEDDRDYLKAMMMIATSLF